MPLLNVPERDTTQTVKCDDQKLTETEAGCVGQAPTEHASHVNTPAPKETATEPLPIITPVQKSNAATHAQQKDFVVAPAAVKALVDSSTVMLHDSLHPAFKTNLINNSVVELTPKHAAKQETERTLTFEHSTAAEISTPQRGIKAGTFHSYFPSPTQQVTPTVVEENTIDLTTVPCLTPTTSQLGELKNSGSRRDFEFFDRRVPSSPLCENSTVDSSRRNSIGRCTITVDAM